MRENDIKKERERERDKVRMRERDIKKERERVRECLDSVKK